MKKFIPRRVNVRKSEDLEVLVFKIIEKKDLKEFYKNWRFYAVDQANGWHHRLSKVITIPVWVFERNRYSKGYLKYYICHELAHWVSTPHDNTFMEELKRLCPKAYLHYEHEYKPRQAEASGLPKRKRGRKRDERQN